MPQNVLSPFFHSEHCQSPDTAADSWFSYIFKIQSFKTDLNNNLPPKKIYLKIVEEM
jgi:hypothetical protein